MIFCFHSVFSSHSCNESAIDEGNNNFWFGDILRDRSNMMSSINGSSKRVHECLRIRVKNFPDQSLLRVRFLPVVLSQRIFKMSTTGTSRGRRATATFGLLAEATSKFLSGTMAVGNFEPEVTASTPDLLVARRQSLKPQSSSTVSGGGSPAKASSWFSVHRLDPGRENVLGTLHKQIRGRNRILASYRRVKTALKDLQDQYVASKDTHNVIARYASMKKMIKEVNLSTTVRVPLSCLTIKAIHRYRIFLSLFMFCPIMSPPLCYDIRS